MLGSWGWVSRDRVAATRRRTTRHRSVGASRADTMLPAVQIESCLLESPLGMHTHGLVERTSGIHPIRLVHAEYILLHRFPYSHYVFLLCNSTHTRMYIMYVHMYVCMMCVYMCTYLTYTQNSNRHEKLRCAEASFHQNFYFSINNM